MIARQIVKAVLTADDEDHISRGNVHGMNLTQELSTRLQQVCDVSKALEVLLVSLELDHGSCSLCLFIALLFIFIFLFKVSCHILQKISCAAFMWESATSAVYSLVRWESA